MKRVQAQFATVAPAMRSAKDIHVAACAAAILADRSHPCTHVVGLVTKNVCDFGVRHLASQGLEVRRPDAFLLDCFRQDGAAVASAFAALRSTLRSAPSPTRLLEQLALGGQTSTATALPKARCEGKRGGKTESGPWK